MVKVLVILVLSTFTSYGQIYKSGTLVQDEIWTMVESPIYIKDDLIIPRDRLLVIKRGVTVYIDSRPNNPIKIVVKGGLKVRGYKNNRVVFTSRGGNGVGAWQGIYYADANEASCQMMSATIENSVIGMDLHATSFTIQNNIFRNNKIGVKTGKKSNAVFINNIFTENVNAGIYITEDYPIIKANIFYNNLNYGILGANENIDAFIHKNGFWGNNNKNVWNIKNQLLGVAIDTNSSGINIDQNENIINNPIFIGSEAEKIAIKNDLATNEIDTIKINDKNFIENFIQKRSEVKYPQRYSRGEYRLSPYSPYIDRGVLSIAFTDEDSTRNDISIYGGPYRRKY